MPEDMRALTRSDQGGKILGKWVFSLQPVDFTLFLLQLRAPKVFAALRQLWWWIRYQAPAPTALRGNCAHYQQYRQRIAGQCSSTVQLPQGMQRAGTAHAALWHGDAQRLMVFSHPRAELSPAAEEQLLAAVLHDPERVCAYSDYEYDSDGELQLAPLAAFDPLAWHRGALVPIVFAIQAELADAMGLREVSSDEQWCRQWARLIEALDSKNTHHLPLPLAKLAAPCTSSGAPVAPRDDNKSISIVIPTRDGGPTLEACIASVLASVKALSLDAEICVVDNASQDPATLRYLAKTTQSHPELCKVWRYDAPFNYSAINNWAVRQCRGEALLLLNDDVQALDTQWLRRMLSLLDDQVGAVGARLCYPDGRIQHDGVALGLGGVAEHPGKGLRPEDPHLIRWARAPQRRVSAVTGACLLTTSALYRELGGLNEADLAVAFNDIDYCLRLSKAGYAVIQCSDAVLIHHESLSRGKEDNWQKHRRFNREIAYMQETWSEDLAADPYYSPHLSLHASDLSFRLPVCRNLAEYGQSSVSS